MGPRKILKLYKDARRITKWSKDTALLLSRWMVEPDESRLMIFDTETTGLDFNAPTILKHKKMEIHCPRPVVFGMSYCLEIKGYPVLVWARMESKLYDEMLTLLNYHSIKVAHNARYDFRMCELEGFKIANRVDCTQTMSRIVYDRRMKHSLQSLSEIWCPELSDWEEAVKKEWTRIQTRSTRSGNPKGYTNYSFIADELMCPYSMTDSFMTWIGYKIMWPVISKTFKELYQREKKVYYIINEVEKRGLGFDYRKAERLAGDLRDKMEEPYEDMEVIAGLDFNPNSPAQVLKALRQLGVEDKQLTEKGKVTTGADKLRAILAAKSGNKKTLNFITDLLLYRAYGKTVGTYLEPLAQRARANNGVVHTSINPADTRTGRMASRNPNLQNIPTLNPRRGRTSGGENPVRSCFLSRKDCTIYYPDYANMEMAVFGLYTDERLILDAYAAGEDVHGMMAKELYGKKYTQIQRDRTKDTNFGVIFGMGVNGMAKARGVSVAEAGDFLHMYHKTFPSIHQLLDQCEYELQQQGYVEDWFGKRYHVSLNQVYKAIPCLVQGGCAQAFKEGVIGVNSFLKTLNWPAYIILPVHDEIQIEARTETIKQEKYLCRHVVEQMTQIPQLLDRGLQLRVNVKKSSTNWAEKVEVKL